jgi:ketosteroid isomerase-like protein
MEGAYWVLSAEQEHLQLIKRLITAIATRNREDFAACLAPNVVLHVPGSTLISGTFRGFDEVMEALARVSEMSGESLRIRLHDVLANDQHGIVMYDVSAQRDGKDIGYSHIDIYHFTDGRISEISGFPSDGQAFNRLYG